MHNMCSCPLQLEPLEHTEGPSQQPNAVWHRIKKKRVDSGGQSKLDEMDESNYALWNPAPKGNRDP